VTQTLHCIVWCMGPGMNSILSLCSKQASEINKNDNDTNVLRQFRFSASCTVEKRTNTWLDLEKVIRRGVVLSVDKNKYAFLISLVCTGGNGGGNPVLSSSPVGAGGDIGPVPNGPHPSYQEYPPSPASWLSDVDSNANNPQY